MEAVTEFNPPSAPNGVSQVLAERPPDSIAVALRRNVSLKDGSLSLGIKRTAGHGGLVFRLADSKNYLALLLDPLSGDAWKPFSTLERTGIKRVRPQVVVEANRKLERFRGLHPPVRK